MSIVGQTYGNLEILIVNDGSTDGSLAVAGRFAASDARVRIVDKANEGLTLTRKRGLEESKGEYVCWIDGDDYIQPDYIEKLLGAMRRYDCDSAAGELMKVSGRVGTVLQSPAADFYSPKEFAESLLLDKVFANLSGRIYKRGLVEGLVWHPQITLWEDFITNIQVALKPGYKGMCTVRDAFYYYMQYPGSMRRRRVEYEYIENFIGCSEALFNRLEDTARLYRPERVANMTERHYVYLRILSNPWRGDNGLSVGMRDILLDNRTAVKGKIPWLVRQATLLYPNRRCFFIVKILVTLCKWGNSFGKRRGAEKVKYAIPEPGENACPQILRK